MIFQALHFDKCFSHQFPCSMPWLPFSCICNLWPTGVTQNARCRPTNITRKTWEKCCVYCFSMFASVETQPFVVSAGEAMGSLACRLTASSKRPSQDEHTNLFERTCISCDLEKEQCWSVTAYAVCTPPQNKHWLSVCVCAYELTFIEECPLFVHSTVDYVCIFKSSLQLTQVLNFWNIHIPSFIRSLHKSSGSIVYETPRIGSCPNWPDMLLSPVSVFHAGMGRVEGKERGESL